MKTITLILAIVLLSGCTISKDIQREALFATLTVIDWNQTMAITASPDCHENNPLLGEHPSRARVDRYFASAITGHALVSWILPEKFRSWWQWWWIGIEAAVVGHNYGMGIRTTF